MGTKRSVLVDKHGLPLSVVLDGANRHDVKLLETTLDHIVISRPVVSEGQTQNLCMDAGYTGSTEIVEARQYTAHIRPRNEERIKKERNPGFKARRWVVEVTHSFGSLCDNALSLNEIEIPENDRVLTSLKTASA